MWIQWLQRGFKWKFIATIAFALVHFSFSAEVGRKTYSHKNRLNFDKTNVSESERIDELGQVSPVDHRNGALQGHTDMTLGTKPTSSVELVPKMTFDHEQGQSRQMPTPQQIAQICGMAMQLIASGQATQAEITALCSMMSGMMPSMAAAMGGAAAGGMGSDVSAMGLKDVVAILGLAIGAKLFLITAGYLLTKLATNENRRVTIEDRFEQDQDVLQSIYSISNRRGQRRRNCKNWGSGVGSAAVSPSRCKPLPHHDFHDDHFDLFSLFGLGHGLGGIKNEGHLLGHRNDLYEDLHDETYDKDWYEYIWSGLRKLVFGS